MYKTLLVAVLWAISFRALSLYDHENKVLNFGHQCTMGNELSLLALDALVSILIAYLLFLAATGFANRRKQKRALSAK